MKIGSLYTITNNDYHRYLLYNIDMKLDVEIGFNEHFLITDYLKFDDYTGDDVKRENKTKRYLYYNVLFLNKIGHIVIEEEKDKLLDVHGYAKDIFNSEIHTNKEMYAIVDLKEIR